jgi:hypothetical protein
MLGGGSVGGSTVFFNAIGSLLGVPDHVLEHLGLLGVTLDEFLDAKRQGHGKEDPYGEGVRVCSPGLLRRGVVDPPDQISRDPDGADELFLFLVAGHQCTILLGTVVNAAPTLLWLISSTFFFMASLTSCVKGARSINSLTPSVLPTWASSSAWVRAM